MYDVRVERNIIRMVDFWEKIERDILMAAKYRLKKQRMENGRNSKCRRCEPKYCKIFMNLRRAGER